MIPIFEIEKNLSHYITREYEKLESKDKQRKFIENFRFLMMSNDTDFQNFNSKKSLNDREFYSIVDSLYQLNNLCMLAEFVTCNKPLLIYEVQKMGNWQGHIDFTEPCRLGHDTMLARIFTILQHFNISTNISYETRDNSTRNLKVQEASGYQTSIPKISLQGKWVEDFGFPIGSHISVECFQNKLVILNNENPK
ncbi:SymE family type I addiction module toxin [[Clostridium] symbiosum]|uniref:SymE family type I addiction module toxin n=3 Tax=Lachnospiraceae TaxID=186803 RepID=UPI002ED01672